MGKVDRISACLNFAMLQTLLAFVTGPFDIHNHIFEAEEETIAGRTYEINAPRDLSTQQKPSLNDLRK